MTFLVLAVKYAFEIFYILIIANCLLSWFPNVNRGNPLIRFIYETTEPFLNLFRRILPMSRNLPIDFSPIIAIFALFLIQKLVYMLLAMFL
ncbi:MAG: YggT family protein [Bacillota bacterium]